MYPFRYTRVALDTVCDMIIVDLFLDLTPLTFWILSMIDFDAEPAEIDLVVCFYNATFTVKIVQPLDTFTLKLYTNHHNPAHTPTFNSYLGEEKNWTNI